MKNKHHHSEVTLVSWHQLVRQNTSGSDTIMHLNWFKMFYVSASVNLFGIVYFLLATMNSARAVVEIGQVKCMLFVNHTSEYQDAHRTCWRKLEKELHEDEKDSKGNPYPVNATVEDFDWDDKCLDHCVYKTTGIIEKDEMLPDKKNTEKLFGKGNISKELYEAITSEWNKCLELSGKVSKEKKYDKCKTVTHHRNCFFHKMREVVENKEVSC